MNCLKKSTLGMLLFSFLIITSCSLDPDSGSNDVDSLKEAYFVEDGTLNFNTREAYEETLNILSKMSSEELDIWQSELGKEFISSRTAFKNLDENSEIEFPSKIKGSYYGGFFTIVQERSGELEIVRTIDSNALASVSNDKGVLKIGSNFYLLSYDHVYEFQNREALNNLTLEAINNRSNQESAKIYNVTRSISHMGGENAAKVGTCNDDYDKRRRFRAELWITNTAPVYSGTGARVKHQKKVAGFWFASSANTLTLDVDGWFSQTGPVPGTVTENVDFTQTEYNEGNIDYAWNECFNASCSFDASARVEVAGVEGGKSGGCVIL